MTNLINLGFNPGKRRFPTQIQNAVGMTDFVAKGFNPGKKVFPIQHNQKPTIQFHSKI